MKGLKRCIHWAGWLLVAVSLYYVATRLGSEWQSIHQWRPGGRELAILVGACFGYALACVFLGLGWQRILHGLGAPALPLYQIQVIYAQSQLGKYLPGNIIHVVGRQLLGRRQGIPHGILAASTLYEFAGLGVASLVLALPLVIDTGMLHLKNFQPWPLVGVGVIAAISGWIVQHQIRRRWPHLLNRRVVLTWLQAWSHYLLFFLLAGALLVALSAAFSSQALEPETAIRLVTIFALSWLAGFVTPGAPSGIGIREGVIVLTLQPLLPGAPAALIALLLRLVTVSGDLLYFLLATGLHPWRQKRIQ